MKHAHQGSLNAWYRRSPLAAASCHAWMSMGSKRRRILLLLLPWGCHGAAMGLLLLLPWGCLRDDARLHIMCITFTWSLRWHQVAVHQCLPVVYAGTKEYFPQCGGLQCAAGFVGEAWFAFAVLTCAPACLQMPWVVVVCTDCGSWQCKPAALLLNLLHEGHCYRVGCSMLSMALLASCIQCRLYRQDSSTCRWSC